MTAVGSQILHETWGVLELLTHLLAAVVNVNSGDKLHKIRQARCHDKLKALGMIDNLMMANKQAEGQTAAVKDAERPLKNGNVFLTQLWTNKQLYRIRFEEMNLLRGDSCS